MTDTLTSDETKAIKYEVLDKQPRLDRTYFPDSVKVVEFSFPEKKPLEFVAPDPKDFVRVTKLGKSHILVTASTVVVGRHQLATAPIQYLDKLAREHGGKIVSSAKTDDGGRFDLGETVRLYSIESV